VSCSVLVTPYFTLYPDVGSGGSRRLFFLVSISILGCFALSAVCEKRIFTVFFFWWCRFETRISLSERQVFLSCQPYLLTYVLFFF